MPSLVCRLISQLEPDQVLPITHSKEMRESVTVLKFKLHDQFKRNKPSLIFLEKLTPLLASWRQKNKLKKPSDFDCKYQISLEKRSRNIPYLINQLISMPKIQAACKFLSDLISYLSGKNIIALSDISQESGSEVAA